VILQIEKTHYPPQAVEELRRQNAELERRIGRHAEDLAAAQDEIGTLASSISHDLRSPLLVIGGFVELLSKHSAGSLDEKGRHYLERIATATGQIGQMMDEVLALSRMSVCEMHFVPTDLEPLVRKVVHELDADKGERRVIWLIGRLPTVLADPNLLRQAISSLVSNALRFTRTREVARIQIGMRSGERGMVFFVRDNGASFDIKHRERMFNALPRQPPSAGSKGCAIKLAHVQRIIQRHGGRLWTETVPDGGATFSFSLPGDLEEVPCPPAQR
jgi:light-regulated signal transduction histidine kinase (bacteriophytochrome)